MLTQPAAIHSSVVGRDGKGLEGVKISTFPAAASTFSDALGNFSIQATRYTRALVFEKKGFLSKKFNLNGFDEKRPVMLELSPENDSMRILPYPNVQVEMMTASPVVKAIGSKRAQNRAPAMRYGMAMASNRIISREPLYYNYTESYQHVEENGFKSTSSAPFIDLFY